MEDPNPSPSNKSSNRDWLKLPPEITISIFHKLGAVDTLNSAQYVCLTWRNLCIDPSTWSTINMFNLGCRRPSAAVLEKIFCHAVDLSAGFVVDVAIESFATDELLDYIIERTTGLKRLRLVFCDLISEDTLCELAENAPFLEELELTLSFSSTEVVQAVGLCCPLLKILKLNDNFNSHSTLCEKEALAIAAHMPELRHLAIVGSKLSNVGLLAILDGCPHLVSLDLRNCCNIRLEGDLARRCHDQIRYLKCPSDSTHDYPFEFSTAGYIDLDEEHISENDEYEDEFADADYSEFPCNRSREDSVDPDYREFLGNHTAAGDIVDQDYREFLHNHRAGGDFIDPDFLEFLRSYQAGP